MNLSLLFESSKGGFNRFFHIRTFTFINCIPCNYYEIITLRQAADKSDALAHKPAGSVSVHAVAHFFFFFLRGSAVSEIIFKTEDHYISVPNRFSFFIDTVEIFLFS